jgi:hypothetical protein
MQVISFAVEKLHGSGNGFSNSIIAQKAFAMAAVKVVLDFFPCPFPALPTDSLGHRLW